MPDRIDDAERAAIDAALRAGKVTKVATGASAFDGYIYDHGTETLVLKTPSKMSGVWGRRKRFDRKVAARRAEVLKMIADGKTIPEIAEALMVTAQNIRHDIKMLKRDGHDLSVMRTIDQTVISRVQAAIDLAPICRSFREISVVIGRDEKELRDDFDRAGEDGDFDRCMAAMRVNRNRSNGYPLKKIAKFHADGVSIAEMARRLDTKKRIVTMVVRALPRLTR